MRCEGGCAEADGDLPQFTDRSERRVRRGRERGRGGDRERETERQAGKRDAWPGEAVWEGEFGEQRLVIMRSFGGGRGRMEGHSVLCLARLWPRTLSRLTESVAGTQAHYNLHNSQDLMQKIQMFHQFNPLQLEQIHNCFEKHWQKVYESQ